MVACSNRELRHVVFNDYHKIGVLGVAATGLGFVRTSAKRLCVPGRGQPAKGRFCESSIK